jgi:hypothetical protein
LAQMVELFTIPISDLKVILFPSIPIDSDLSLHPLVIFPNLIRFSFNVGLAKDLGLKAILIEVMIVFNPFCKKN